MEADNSRPISSARRMEIYELERAQRAFIGEMLWLIASQLNALATGGDFPVPDWFDTFGRPGSEEPDAVKRRVLDKLREEPA